MSTPTDLYYFCGSLLERCIATKNLNHGKLLHSFLLKTALNLNVFLGNRLLYMYSKCNSIESARKAFHDLPTKNTHSWNTMISAYAENGLFENAHKLFDEIPKPNLVSYNSVISGLTRHGHHKESISIFLTMQKQFDHPYFDKFTLVSISSACAGLVAVKLLRQVHGLVIAVGQELNLIMYNVLIDAYGKCGDPDASRGLFDQMPIKDVVSWTSMVVAYMQKCRVEEACWVFHQMPQRNSVSWTALVSGYAQNGQEEKALHMFDRMQEEGFVPSTFTFVSVLSACANLALTERGRQLHGQIMRSCVGDNFSNVFICNALIDMYAKCGDMNSATVLFEAMSERDIVSWNSLVTGFAQNGYGRESLSIFERMIQAGVTPNHVTCLGVLSACSHAGLVSEGHKFLDSMESKYGVSPRSEHYAILIDLLGRKNQLNTAMELIESASKGFDNVGMWGALLGACRIHSNLDLAKRVSEPLFDLEPENAARYVMLSNIYASAGRWDDVRRVRGLMRVRGLRKQPAFSCIEIRNERHNFIAEDKSHDHTKEIYESLSKLADHMKDAEYVPSQTHFLVPNEEDGLC